MSKEYCCKFMKEQLTYSCPVHGNGSNCPDVIVSKARDNTLLIIGRNAEYECNYCPYCGTKVEKEY